MPDELPKQIDRELKSYAEKRRKDFDGAVPPQLRQAFQRELERTYASKSKMGFGAMLKKYWPQFGVAAAASILLATGLFLYEGRLKQEQLATAKTYESEKSQVNSSSERSDTTAQLRSSAPSAIPPSPADFSSNVMKENAREELQLSIPDEKQGTDKSAFASAPSPQASGTSVTKSASEVEQELNRKYSRVNRTLRADRGRDLNQQNNPKEAGSSSRDSFEALERRTTLPERSQKEEAPRIAATAEAKATLQPATQERTTEPNSETVDLALASASVAGNPAGQARSSEVLQELPQNNPALDSFDKMATNLLEPKAGDNLILSKESNSTPEIILSLARQQDEAKSALSNFTQQPNQQDALRYSYGETAQASAPILSFVNKVTSHRPQVLQNFRLLNQNPAITIIDSDGSLYTGNVLNVSITAKEQTQSGNLQAESRAGSLGGSQSGKHGIEGTSNSSGNSLGYSSNSVIPFFVQGISQTLNKQVQVTGKLQQINSPAPTQQQQTSRARKMMSPREATAKNYRTTSQTMKASPSVTISGTVQIGETNNYPLDAIAPAQP